MIGTPLHARVFKFQFCILLRPPSFFCPNSPTGPTFWHVSNRTPFTSTSLLSEPAKAIFLKNARIRVHKKQIRTMIIFTTEKDCDTKLSLTTLLPFLSSKFHSILSFLSSLNHLASYLFKGSSHIVRRKGKCVETYRIHKLYKIKTPLFLSRCWWWGSCSSPPLMLMTNMMMVMTISPPPMMLPLPSSLSLSSSPTVGKVSLTPSERTGGLRGVFFVSKIHYSPNPFSLW